MSDIDGLRRQLGLPPAPLVLTGLSTTCAFFAETLRVDANDWVAYLRGIDFHKPVNVTMLPAGTRLARHRPLGTSRQKPFVYFTVPGTSPTSTGTTFDATTYQELALPAPVKALVSSATWISFNDVSAGRIDPVSRAGGGTQYIIAASDVPVEYR
jgi:hypothetical protein